MRGVDTGAETLLRRAFDAAVAACHPRTALGGRLPPVRTERVLILGAGKPSAAMAQVAEEYYTAEGVAVSGAVVAPYGYSALTERIALLEASHPVPDGSSASAAARVLALADSVGEGDQVVCLIGGGGSALLCSPSGVSLADKIDLNWQLLASGAAISEINAVRKHLSGIKGGRLAARIHPASVQTLAISDVAGDDPATIAAGPTVADPTTFQDALDVMRRYGLSAPAVIQALEAGARGETPETVKPGDPRLERGSFEVVASAHTALSVASRVFEDAGCTVQMAEAPEVGDAQLAAEARAHAVARLLTQGVRDRPMALLSGGEVTVFLGDRVSNPDGSPSRGGPNGEYAIAFAAALRNALAQAFSQDAAERTLERVCMLSADSDGIDGAGGFAGALFGRGTLARLDPDAITAAIERADSNSVLVPMGAALVTGPTATNVNDLRFILLLPEET